MSSIWLACPPRLTRQGQGAALGEFLRRILSASRSPTHAMLSQSCCLYLHCCLAPLVSAHRRKGLLQNQGVCNMAALSLRPPEVRSRGWHLAGTQPSAGCRARSLPSEGRCRGPAVEWSETSKPAGSSVAMLFAFPPGKILSSKAPPGGFPGLPTPLCSPLPAKAASPIS